MKSEYIVTRNSQTIRCTPTPENARRLRVPAAVSSHSGPPMATEVTTARPEPAVANAPDKTLR
jgi:hypothetical protein